MKLTKIYNLYLSFLTTLVALPFLAPILLKLGAIFPAKLIYLFYSFTCHQFHSRSLHIFDHQCAWCARDTGIWVSWLLAAFLVKKGYIKELKWYYLPLFILPIAIDGGIQTFFTLMQIGQKGEVTSDITYISNNFTRYVTGSIFGFGVGWFFSWQLLKSTTSELPTRNASHSDAGGQNDKTKKQQNEKFRNFNLFISYLRKPLIISASLFILYIALIQLWSLTSTKYKPTNFLDSKPKIQEEFFLRRANGICPANESNALAVDCFF